MTEENLDLLLNKWDLSAPPEDANYPGDLSPAPNFGALHRRLCWFGEHLWSDYLPAQHHGCNPSYSARLAEWIGNTESEEEQKLLLIYAGYITFLTHADISAMHRAAFDGPITRWVIDQVGLRLTNAAFQAQLRDELYRNTWFCPVTDSMDINEFYHINHLTGISHRPAFSTLRMLDDKDNQTLHIHFVNRLKAFVTNPDARTKAPRLRRLVLLEDFVGSGTQSKEAIVWAVETLDIPVLFVPLMICPKGFDEFEALAAKYPGKFFFKPLITLKKRDLLGPDRNDTPGIHIAKLMEEYAKNSFKQVAGGVHTNKKKAPYSPFGWEQTGCSIVSYSNTPNNTLPLVHHHSTSGKWKPLFPRAARV